MWLSLPLSFLSSLQMTTTRSWQVSAICPILFPAYAAYQGRLPALHSGGYRYAPCFVPVPEPFLSRHGAARWGQ